MKIKYSFNMFPKDLFFFNTLGGKKRTFFELLCYMAWSISERMGHCLQGKGWLCLFGAYSDLDHKGFPAKNTMNVISNTWRVSMVTQKHEGTPGEWLWTTFSFVTFVFHYIWHFWSWAFKEIPLLEEHTGDIFQWNVERSQKKTGMAGNRSHLW